MPWGSDRFSAQALGRGMEQASVDAKDMGSGAGADNRFPADGHIPENDLLDQALIQTADRKEANGGHMLIGLVLTTGLMAALISVPLALAWLVLNLVVGVVLIRTARWVSRQAPPTSRHKTLLDGLLLISAMSSCSAAHIFYFMVEDHGALAAIGYLYGVLMYILVNYSASERFLKLVSAPFFITLLLLPLISAASPPFMDAFDLVFAVCGIGSALGFIVASKITLQFNRVLNEALQDSEANRRAADEANTRLTEALGQTGMGLYDYDVRAGTVHLSDFARTLLGDDDQAAIATLRDPSNGHVHHEDAEQVLNDINEVLTGRKPILDTIYRLQGPHEEGLVRWIRSRGVAHFDADGTMSRFIGSLSDITDEMWMQFDLEQARKAAESASAGKSAFLATMSHEIRTPMNGVLGMAQALSDSNLNPDQRGMVDVIRECGASLLSILNDVLDISKIESGRMTITPVDGDLKDLVTGVIQLWAPTAQEKGLSLDVTISDTVPRMLSFDPVRVRQCLSNLVSNAVKFTKTGGVTVDVGCTIGPDGKGMVGITVTDTGLGIPEDVQERLFAPFTQADGSTARHHGGTGLGLSISRSLARLMGGDLTVASTMGRGSAFTLHFEALDVSPSDGQVKAEDAADADDAASLRDIKVLVVDDNAVNRQVARLFLDYLGAHITDAANGQEALDAMEGQAFDLVLLDMHMPVMDGAEALSRLRKADAPWSAVPVIALTADAMVGDRERCLSLGADGYVPKPIDLAELRSEITRVTA